MHSIIKQCTRRTPFLSIYFITIEWTGLVVERQSTLMVCPSADTHKTVAYTCRQIKRMTCLFLTPVYERGGTYMYNLYFMTSKSKYHKVTSLCVTNLSKFLKTGFLINLCNLYSCVLVFYAFVMYDTIKIYAIHINATGA